MTTVKLSQLTELTTPSSNTEQTFLLVTDAQSGSPISKKMSIKTLDTLIDVTQSGANAAFTKANASFNQANAAFITANAAFDYANTLASSSIDPYARNHSNAAFDAANAATATDTTQNNSITSAFAHANAAFITANTPSNVSNSAASYANSAFIHANAAFDYANTLSSGSVDTYARNHANAAFDAANAATATDTTQNNSITAAFNHSNSAFDAANAATATDTTQNNSITSAFIHANSGFDFANVAANLALSFGATTILEVTNSGSSSYRFTQYGVLDNPNVSTFSATTLGFKLNVSGHPFHIRTGDNTADFDTGLVHVSTTGTLSYDSAAQGKVSGTLFWRIPHNAVGNYKYRCSIHTATMIGDINVANTANIYFTHST